MSLGMETEHILPRHWHYRAPNFTGRRLAARCTPSAPTAPTSQCYLTPHPPIRLGAWLYSATHFMGLQQMAARTVTAQCLAWSFLPPPLLLPGLKVWQSPTAIRLPSRSQFPVCRHSVINGRSTDRTLMGQRLQSSR